MGAVPEVELQRSLPLELPPILAVNSHLSKSTFVCLYHSKQRTLMDTGMVFLILKMVRRPEWTFSKKDIHMANTYMKYTQHCSLLKKWKLKLQ